MALTGEILSKMVAEKCNGVDCASRFSGPNGWPPEMTVPESADLTLNVFGPQVLEAIANAPKMPGSAFNTAAALDPARQFDQSSGGPKVELNIFKGPFG